jgi:hypothetical protein
MDCCCAYNDGDEPEFYKELERRARKQYECCECGGAIEKGSLHHYAAGVYGGRWSTHRTCIGCHRLRVDVSCGNGWVFGQLREDILDCTGYDYVTGEDLHADT